MPTQQQRDGVVAAGDARRKAASAEAAALAAETARLAARLAGGSTTDQEQARDKARDAQQAANASLDAARAAVLAGGSGVELLDSALPVALFPVRLETRYSGATLLVRIYPDEVHADGHEQPITPSERQWIEQYHKRLDAATDRRPWVEAWQQLVQQAGVHRALYLATLENVSAAGSRPGSWSRAARARLLPDRFVAFAWTSASGRTPIRTAAPSLVREPLPLGPDPLTDDPTDPSPLGEASRWLHDFKAALAAGMALEIPLGASNVTVSRLVVLGARASVDPDAQAAELGDLLRAHDFTHGLDLPAPGSPTNALPGARPAYSSRPDPVGIYDDALGYRIRGATRERRPPGFIVEAPGVAPRRERRAASLMLATALGIDPVAVGYTHGSRDMTEYWELQMRTVICTAFERRVALALSPAVDAESVAAGIHHASFASALGAAVPLVRVGTQPYGVVPVTMPERDRLEPVAAGIYRMLDGLRAGVFEPAVGQVTRVGATGGRDPGDVLIDILRAEGVAREWYVRLLVDADAAALVRQVLPAGALGDLERKRKAVVALLASLGVANPADTRIANSLLLEDAALVVRPLVAPADAAGVQSPAVYLDWLRTLPLTAILDAQYPNAPAQPPSGLLFDLCRLAVLEAADADARATLEQDGQVNPAAFDEEHGALGTPRLRLARPAPLNPAVTLAERLSNRTTGEAVRTSAVYAALGELASLPAPTLEMLLSATAGLFGSRLDAWYTAFALQQLHVLRYNPPPGRSHPDGFFAGLGVGAFGWVEAIARRGQAASAGYVHGPSGPHAAAAGVLLSADHAHQQAGHGGAFAVDLSSARVRGAKELLEGLRAEQPLGALLGYRIERALVTAGGTAPALVARIRSIAPLVAKRLHASSGPVEAEAADHVVDGLALLRLATGDWRLPPLSARLPAGLNQPTAATADQVQALERGMADALDSLDAASDLLLAEGVYQMVSGRPTATGSATDVTSGAFVPPSEVEVIRTPQRGIGVTHRVFAAFDPTATPATGWEASPRAAADPCVEAWAASLLPPPTKIRVRARFTPAGSQQAVELDATLASLFLGPAGTWAPPGLAALDLVLDADPNSSAASGALESRLRALAWNLRPAAAGDAEATLVFDRGGSWTSDEYSVPEALEIGRAIREVVGGGRPVLPSDLPFGAAVNEQDLADRFNAAQRDVTDAATSIDAARAAGASSAAATAALFAAQACGIRVAPDAAHLDGQLRAVAGELHARLDAATDSSLDWRERIRRLFANGLPVVPLLTLADLGLASAFQEDVGATAGAVRTFLARAATVRGRVAQLQAALCDADAVAGASPPYEFAVAQRPCEAGEAWAALPGVLKGGRISLVAVRARGTAAIGSTPLAGLLVDEWTETVPLADADTSLAFHCDAPSSAAPNAIVLCVPQAGREQWSENDLLDHVVEALSLAKLRAVDSDRLGQAGHLLPALLASDDAYQPSAALRLSS